jgi:predicted LPLAT superfamily acyltransferase
MTTTEQIDPARKIAARKRGNRLGLWFFETALRLFGLRGAYGLLYLVCPYYLLFDRAAVRASLAYIRRRFPRDRTPKHLWHVFRLFISQGRSLIDRHYLVGGLGKFDLTLHGREKIAPLLEHPEQGFILLTTHMGNWQVAMTVLTAFGKPVCLLMRPEDNPAVRESLQVDSQSATVKVLSPESFLGGVVELLRLVQSGHIVSIMGDRSYGHTSVTVPFLGDLARFPCGAFSIAAAANCPVVVLLSAKQGVRAYRVDIAAVFRPAYAPGGSKRRQLRQWVGEFAGMLEGYAKDYPLQFFLFHDIWAEAMEAPATAQTSHLPSPK